MRRTQTSSILRKARLHFLSTAALAACALALQIGCLSDTATSAPNPSNLGDSVTFTATLTAPGPPPTGTITFLDGGNALAPAIPISPGNPTTLAIASLTVGMHSVVANYSGDMVYGSASSPPVIQVVVAPATDYFTVPSCRLVDTRGAAGDYGAPPLSANTERTFIAWGQCGIPTTARSIAANLAVTSPTADGDLRVYFSGTPAPFASALNYRAGQTRGNNAEIPLGADGGFTVYTEQGSGTTHLIVDVNGYFQ